MVSRWFLIGGVSVVIRPCLGVFYGGFLDGFLDRFLVLSSVVSWWFLCGVLGADSSVSRCFRGDFLMVSWMVSWWCLGGFLVVSLWSLVSGW